MTIDIIFLLGVIVLIGLAIYFKRTKKSQTQNPYRRATVSMPTPIHRTAPTPIQRPRHDDDDPILPTAAFLMMTQPPLGYNDDVAIQSPNDDPTFKGFGGGDSGGAGASSSWDQSADPAPEPDSSFNPDSSGSEYCPSDCGSSDSGSSDCGSSE